MSKEELGFGTKAKQLADPGSCWNKAKDGELVFTLLERDPVAGETVEFWANARLRRGIDAPDSPKITDAMRWSEAANASPLRLGDKGPDVITLGDRPVSVPVGSREYTEYMPIPEADVLKFGLDQAIASAAAYLTQRAMSRLLFESMGAGYALQHTFALKLTYHDADGNKLDGKPGVMPKGGEARLTSLMVLFAKPALFIDENGKPQNYPRPKPVPVDEPKA